MISMGWEKKLEDAAVTVDIEGDPDSGHSSKLVPLWRAKEVVKEALPNEQQTKTLIGMCEKRLKEFYTECPQCPKDLLRIKRNISHLEGIVKILKGEA